MTSTVAKALSAVFAAFIAAAVAGEITSELPGSNDELLSALLGGFSGSFPNNGGAWDGGRSLSVAPGIPLAQQGGKSGWRERGESKV